MTKPMSRSEITVRPKGEFFVPNPKHLAFYKLSSSFSVMYTYSRQQRFD